MGSSKIATYLVRFNDMTEDQYIYYFQYVNAECWEKVPRILDPRILTRYEKDMINWFIVNLWGNEQQQQVDVVAPEYPDRE